MTGDTKIDAGNKRQERATTLEEFEWLIGQGETLEHAARQLGYTNLGTFDGIIRQARREREAGRYVPKGRAS